MMFSLFFPTIRVIDRSLIFWEFDILNLLKTLDVILKHSYGQIEVNMQSVLEQQKRCPYFFPHI